MFIASIVLLLAAAAAAVVLLTVGGSDSDPAATTVSTTAPGDTTPVAPSTQPAPPSTATPGEPAPMGTAVVVQELSGACAEAVAPLRQLMKDYESGYVIDAKAAEIMNVSMGKARQACSAEDFKNFNEDEFLGWLAPAPSN